MKLHFFLSLACISNLNDRTSNTLSYFRSNRAETARTKNFIIQHGKCNYVAIRIVSFVFIVSPCWRECQLSLFTMFRSNNIAWTFSLVNQNNMAIDYKARKEQ